jgi:hypothetical protein
MTMPRLPILFHTGMIVHRLEPAMADMSAAFDYHWAEPFVSERKLKTPEGIRSRTWRLTYSVEGPHHVELVEQLDDTALRDLTGGPIVHHLGFEVADVADEVKRLESLGFHQELTDVGLPDVIGGNAFVYNHHGGLWLEFISSERRAKLERWIAGGPPPNMP